MQRLAPAQGFALTTLVVLQPSYLPWLGYFDQLQKADVFVWYDDVQFDKNGWRNRNRLKSPSGVRWLTVPVLQSGRAEQPIHDVMIDDRQPWRHKHVSSIEQWYARAPFVSAMLPQLREIIEQPWERLVDLDIAIVDWMAARTRHRHAAPPVVGAGHQRRPQQPADQSVPTVRRNTLPVGRLGTRLSRCRRV